MNGLLGETWDEAFVTVASAWNVVGLPLLVAAWLGRAFASRQPPPDGAVMGRGPAVRRLGLIHYGLAAWSLVRVAEESWAYRLMGIFPSNPLTGLPGSVLALLCDVTVGLGLRRFKRWSRSAAAALALIRTLVAAFTATLWWRNQTPVDWTEWPRLAVSHVLPPLTLLMLMLPRTGRVFRRPPEPSLTPRRDLVLGLAMLAFVLVVVSVAATDALGLLVQVLVETTGGGGP